MRYNNIVSLLHGTFKAVHRIWVLRCLKDTATKLSLMGLKSADGRGLDQLPPSGYLLWEPMLS